MAHQAADDRADQRCIAEHAGLHRVDLGIGEGRIDLARYDFR
jgi:hypothetical protein